MPAMATTCAFCTRTVTRPFYAHMQYLFVSTGAVVTAGQVLGVVGETGNATGPHLHFEILHKGLRYDPAQALQDAA